MVANLDVAVAEFVLPSWEDLSVSFETPIVYQFPGELPTELLSVIIPVKYVILKSKLS